MRNRILKNSGIAFLVFGFILIVSCSNTKNLKSDKHSNTETSTQESEEIYGLIVSFYSPGNGIDRQAKNGYIGFLSTKYPKLVFEKIKWGREGEVDFCFLLDELTDKQKGQFIKKSKKLLSDSQKVHFYEDRACAHK